MRHCILYKLRQAKTAAEATKLICLVYGSDALEVRIYQNWFIQGPWFEDDDFELEDKERSGRPNLIVGLHFDRLTQTENHYGFKLVFILILCIH